MLSAQVTAQTADLTKRAPGLRNFSVKELLQRHVPQPSSEMSKFDKAFIEKAMEISGVTPKKKAPAKKAQKNRYVESSVANRVDALNAKTTFRAEAIDDNGIITAPAEGTTNVYTISGSGYKYSGGQSNLTTLSGSTQIVECEDGTVYFKNIVSTYATGAWVKGVKNGNTITVAAKQPIYYNTTYDATQSVRWARVEGSDVVAADETGDFIFTVDDEAKTISLQGSTADLFMAVLWDDDNTWTGNGVFGTVYTFDHEYVAPSIVTITAPEGLQTEEWYTKGHTYSNGSLNSFKGRVTIGFDGSDVYLQGVFSTFPEAWIKGTIDGTTVTFSGLQYLGVEYGYDILSIGTDGEGLCDFVMNYDAEAGVLASDASNALLANAAEDRIFYLEWIDDITISRDAPAVPTFEVPYYNYFDTEEDTEILTIIDVNGDGSTWTSYYDQYEDNAFMRYKYNGDNDADDWLILPGIQLEAGKGYTFSLDAWAQSSFYPERVEVMMGKADNAEAMTIQVIEPTDLETEDVMTLLNYDITVEESGVYYFGIHAISDADNYYLNVDNATVTETNYNVPAAPQLTAVAGEKAALQATVTVVAPTTTLGGEALSANINYLVVMRDDQILQVLTDVAPGATEVIVDTELETGYHVYQAYPFNLEGRGLSSEKVEVYVGYDVPAEVTGVQIQDGVDFVKVSWDEVGEKGENGYYVDPAQVTYNVCTMELDPFSYMLGYIVYVPTDTLVKVTGKNRTFIDMKTNEGEQDFLMLGVVPTNEGGEGMYGEGRLIVGAPYELPFRETGERNYLIASDASDETVQVALTDESSDGDGVGFIFLASKEEETSWGAIEDGKISLKGNNNPVMTFDYALFDEADSIKVTILGLQGALKTYTFGMGEEDDWTTAQINLSEFTRLSFIRYRIEVQMNAGPGAYLDNINLFNQYPNDLAIESFQIPARMKPASDANIIVVVKNWGENDAENYTLRVTVGNEVICNEESTEPLKQYDVEAYAISYSTDIFAEAGVRDVNIEVIYDADDYQENNAVSGEIEVVASNVPTVTNLEVNNNVATWEGPESGAPTEQNESFEDASEFEEFSIGGITAEEHYGSLGNWTLYDGNGTPCYGFSSVDVPNLGSPSAFIVMNPGSEQLSADLSANYPAHSGDQYLMSVCTSATGSGSSVIATDHWLISPVLPGTAQTISFFARELTTNYGPETYEILVSTTDNKVESFTKIAEGSIASTEWEQYSYDLPEGTMYFAIRHTSTDVFGLMLDDFTFVASNSLAVAAYNVYVDKDLYDSTQETTIELNNVPADYQLSVTVLYTNGAQSAPVTVDVKGGVFTAIEQLMATGKPVNIYTIDGRQVRQATKPGVYVVDGKKAIVR